MEALPKHLTGEPEPEQAQFPSEEEQEPLPATPAIWDVLEKLSGVL